MKNGKYSKRRGVASKTLVLALAVMLIVGATIGGTIAWLTDKTDAVTNTFTVGDINISLTETWNTDTDDDKVNDAWSAKLVPGAEYAKNPVVTVKAKSEKCYLFVKISEVNNPTDTLSYTLNLEGWIKLDGAATDGDVYYRVVDASEADQSWHLLTGDKVTVKTGVTKEQLTASTFKAPTLTFKAYAVQFEHIAGVNAAWNEVKDA